MSNKCKGGSLNISQPFQKGFGVKPIQEKSSSNIGSKKNTNGNKK